MIAQYVSNTPRSHRVQSNGIYTINLHHFLALICIITLILGGCDDDVPSPPETTQVGSMRDASMEIMPFEDYLTAGSSGDVMDFGLAGETAGSTSGTTGADSECLAGDTRMISSCGLERCLNGRWSVEQNARERCNDHDDDCDGRVDESFSIGGMCFVDNAQGCRIEGEYQCDPNTEAAMCVTSATSSTRPELCDGIDNDCDEIIDEGFEDGPQCCTEQSHCPDDLSCIDSICTDLSSTRPEIDPNAPLGSCGQPIWMSGFNVYPADGNIAQKELAVANCTGDLLDDVVLLGQTALGSEVVFAFSLSQAQRVRFSVELTLFASVLYVFEGQCNPEQAFAPYCDQSILGLASEPARGAEIILEAQANQLYYVVLDTKLDLVELLEFTGGSDLGSIPFVLSFNAAP